ncbi:MAG: putative arginyl-tRNA--protein transferase [candidate division WS6 bacterium OLB20]|uniref:Putative arginyl-tRNA--protein transferase n=1 Tax=candidate division WS6 bacterium OLB20 TaxID=1617426 RepID=A0A136M0N0_9BACT|nr:MAG: putative arginyl-tRNA--protein transferase [candidate division WS6 bacterium OLB20]
MLGSMGYINWGEKTVDVTDDQAVSSAYDEGYVFIRTSPGAMQKTRSLRVDLAKFTLNSENRRVLRKLPGLSVQSRGLPIPKEEYDWNIHRTGKEFYGKKFNDISFSAARIRYLLTSPEMHFSTLLQYAVDSVTAGYAICYANGDLLHYAYPFYEFENYPANLGMAMMVHAILLSKETGRKYCYLGSVRSVRDLYKLQFSGLSYYDRTGWSSDLDPLKAELRQ